LFIVDSLVKLVVNPYRLQNNRIYIVSFAEGIVSSEGMKTQRYKKEDEVVSSRDMEVYSGVIRKGTLGIVMYVDDSERISGVRYMVKFGYQTVGNIGHTDLILKRKA